MMFDKKMVGAVRFELTTSWSRTKRATKLRYAPTHFSIKRLQKFSTISEEKAYRLESSGGYYALIMKCGKQFRRSLNLMKDAPLPTPKRNTDILGGRPKIRWRFLGTTQRGNANLSDREIPLGNNALVEGLLPPEFLPTRGNIAGAGSCRRRA